MKKVNKFIKRNLHWFIVGGVALLCALFIIFGHWSENGKYRTLDGSDAKISEGTKQFIEDAQAALNRIMNVDKPTDDDTIHANEGEGQGFYTTIDNILGRRLPDGDNDNGKGWQCSKYTAYLATGKREYSSVHPDYGPVNGKNVAAWLVNNYGFKYVDQPVQGAIGSGGFNTTYGHTAMYLYSTGTHTAMVNDANYVPLTVATHNMNIDGWVWVVPGDYNPTPQPTPSPTPDPQPTPIPVADCKTIKVVKGDTMSAIMRRCTGRVVWGSAMNNYANLWISGRTGQSVFYGWITGAGYGLIAGDTITYTGD